MTVLLVAVALGVGGVAVWLATRVVQLRRTVESLEAASRAEPEPGERTAESLRDLTAAMNAMDLAVVAADAAGTIWFRNEASERILTSNDNWALVRGEVRQLLQIAASGVTAHREIDLFGPPPASFAIEAIPLASGTDDRDVSGSVALIRNITERRRLDQVRRDFVANISHELKTPVGAVGLIADTLREETDPEVIERLTARISDEMERLAVTIDDLLELSRIEFGDDTNTGPVDLAEAAEIAAARLRSGAEATGVTIVVEDASSVVVMGDSRQITSALSNLIDNAVKYSPDGGTVRVVASSERPHEAQVAVIDEGIGIPARDLDRVFERFYRVDRSRRRVTGGTGLGLAIVRHVAQNHGGHVDVDSREGRGSTFTLTLPIVGDPHRATTGQLPLGFDTPGSTASEAGPRPERSETPKESVR